jgi:glycosyltransferase involved in cell wall biosynthesis
MTKKVLMIAFHFPPNPSIGVQRTFKTAEYLPEFGWEPIILTAKPTAYDTTESSQEISESLLANTYRTTAFDVHRHMTVMGKHLGWMAMIDRWTTWVPGAVWQGRKIIKEHKPDLIWSTSPIPSAHIIARILSKKYDIPWVADYRDPMKYHNYPTPPVTAKALKYIDVKTIESCKAAVFTTPKAMELYRDHFNQQSPDKFFTVENGYDEANWEKLNDHKLTSKNPISTTKFSLLYSGVLYQNGRDPTPLFQALKKLKHENRINKDNFELIFQGAGDGSVFVETIEALGIAALVRFMPSVPYLDSLFYIKEANALVIIQDKVFNFQIPGKLYECIRTGNPIIVITPEDSSTAWAANKYALSSVVKTEEQVRDAILKLLKKKNTSLDTSNVQQFSRFQKASEITDIFNHVIANNSRSI